MKTILLQGGLGNQMFQYAVARSLEKKRDKSVYLDLVFLEINNKSTETFTTRGFELNIFYNLRYRVLSIFRRNILRNPSLKYRIIKRIVFNKVFYVKQADNKFINLPLHAKNIYLDGFFQSEKYFKDIRDDLLHDFRFPLLDDTNLRILDRTRKENTVSIHIRRGDYLKKKEIYEYHGILSLEYYKEAISLLASSIDISKCVFFIFSDDIEYIKTHFTFLQNIEIVDVNKGSDSWKDMYLMSSCNHHIIANSTFSWWGAWLSKREGINIAPYNWFSGKVEFNIRDFIPDTWITI